MPRKTVKDKPHLAARGETRSSTRLPWGGTQEEFNNLIYQTQARVNVRTAAERDADPNRDTDAAANEQAVLENQRRFGERPPANNPRRRRD